MISLTHGFYNVDVYIVYNMLLHRIHEITRNTPSALYYPIDPRVP